MARRSLKHAALALLVPSLPGGEAERLLGEHYRLSDNLTDRQAALTHLTRHPGIRAATRERLLEDFYGRWQHEALVVNVWFSVQAASPLYDAEQVRALSRHRAFDARNPNKLRALYGAFSRQNHRCFHSPDGAGYRFLGETVLALDERNPSMAANLAMPLTRWRRFDPKRGELMRGVLSGIAESERLSRDLFEVVSKSLVEPSGT